MKNKTQNKVHDDKEKEMLETLREKPRISNLSVKLSSLRAKTPVVERLYKVKRSISPIIKSNIPTINLKSRELCKNRSEKVFMRLFSRSTSPEPNQELNPSKSLANFSNFSTSSPIFIRKKVKFTRFGSPYRINTSKGTTIDNTTNMNEMDYSLQMQKFLAKASKALLKQHNS